MMNDQITLCKINREKGTTGAPKVNAGETQRVVFAEIESIGRKDYYESAAIGKTLAFKATIYFDEFDGDQEVIYDGERYTIARTFRLNNQADMIELYCEAKSGV